MAEPNVPISAPVDIRTGKPHISQANVPLDQSRAFGGGGGSGGPVEPTVSWKEWVEKADEAVESRLSAKLDKLPSSGQLWAAVATLIGGIFTLIAIGLGALAFASSTFNGGISAEPIVTAAAAKQVDVDKKQDAQIALMNAKLDLLIRQTASQPKK